MSDFEFSTNLPPADPQAVDRDRPNKHEKTDFIEKYSPIDLDLLQKISRNDDFINQQKLEIKIRNVDATPDKDGDKLPRDPPDNPFKYDKMVVFSDTINLAIRDHGIYDNDSKFDWKYEFPQSDKHKHGGGKFFSDHFLPVVHLSLAFPHLSKSIVIPRIIRTDNVVFTILELSTKKKLRDGQDFSVEICAIGVKGPYFDAFN